MKQRKNNFFQLAALLVVLSMIIGACASTATKAPAPVSEQPAQNTAAPVEKTAPTAAPTLASEVKPAEPPAEITYYFPGGALPDAVTVEEAMNAILIPKINATIKLMPVDWGAYDQKVNMMFTGKEVCDIVFTAPWINNYYQAVHNESLLPLDDLLPKSAPTLWAYETPADWDAVRVGGKIYAVPTLANRAKWWGFGVRQDLMTKYNLNLDSIKKLSDLEPFMADVVKGDPDVIPWGVAPHFRQEMYGWDPLDDSIGYDDVSIISVDAFSPDLKAFNVLESPEWQNYVKMMRDWYNKGYVVKEDDPDYNASMSAGKYAMHFHMANPDLPAEYRVNWGKDFVAKVLTPKDIKTTGSVSAVLNGVCATSKHPEQALKFLELLHTDTQIANLMAYGVEGKHYVWVDQSKNLIGSPEGKQYADTGYFPNQIWMFGNMLLSYYNDSWRSDHDSWKEYITRNNAAVPSQAIGFAFDRSNVQTEIANVKAAAQEFCQPLAHGWTDPDTALTTCIQKVKDAGIDKLLVEMQKQLDTFNAAKK